MAVIQPHEILGILGTLLTLALMLVRWRSRRRSNDIGTTTPYLTLAVVGLIWLFFLGGTGGNLVYEYGINVRGVNPLLP